MEYESFPGMTEGLDKIEAEVTRLSSIDELLKDDRSLWTPAVLETLHTIAVDAKTLAVDGAVTAFQRGHITKRGAADRLRMHPNTFGKIVDDRTEHTS